MNDAPAESIKWIKDTALGVTVRELSFIAPHAHENMLEITMCLQGSITFDYCFEKFRLREGEFILVDRDTHYLHSGENAVCASFYINLAHESGRYRHLTSRMLVCEGAADSTIPLNAAHDQMRGMLIAVLDYLLWHDQGNAGFEKDIERITDRIVNLVDNKFDICCWQNAGSGELSEKSLTRLKKLVDYLFQHYREKVTLQNCADLIGVSKGYMSYLFSKQTIGFNHVITYIRTWNAERLLLTTDMSIEEISSESNFSATKYMYAAFDYWYHCTPNEYRKKYRSEMKKSNVYAIIPIEDVQTQIIKLTNEQLIRMYIKGEKE